MDPVSQVLAQQNSGSAQGQGFGQFFVAGQQAGLARRRLDLEQRQERRLQRRDDLLLPLEQELQRAQITNLGIQAQFNKEKLDALTTQNAVMPEIMRLETEFALSGDGYADPQLFSRVQSLADRYPKAFAPGMPGEGLVNSIRAVPMLRQKLQQARDALDKLQPGSRVTVDGMTLDKDSVYGSEAGSGPEVKVETDPATGQKITFYRTPRGWSRVPPQLSDKPEIVSAIDPNTGNPVSFARTSPNSISRIPLSPGQNELEKAEIASGDVFETGRKLFPLINDRTTGIRGGLQRLARDAGLGLIAPEMLDPQVSEADAVAREFAAKIVRGLRSDGNINEREFQALQQEANTLKWVDEKTGKTRLMAFIEGSVRKARDSSMRLGRPINEKYLTADEIIDRAEAKKEAGELTKEKAIDWALKTHNSSAAKLIEEIRASIGSDNQKQ